MEKYLKQKIPLKSNDLEERIAEELEFKKNVQKLEGSKPQMVDSFQKPMIKDLPVDKLNTLGEKIPLKSEADFISGNLIKQADLAAAKIDRGVRRDALEDLVYNAANTKKEYIEKAAQDGAKKIYGKNAPVNLDYNQIRKQASKGSIKKLSLGGLAAGLATALGSAALPASAMASTPVKAGFRALEEGDPASLLIPGDAGPQPGSLDERIEQGSLTEEDKQLLRREALKNFSR